MKMNEVEKIIKANESGIRAMGVKVTYIGTKNSLHRDLKEQILKEAIRVA